MSAPNINQITSQFARMSDQQIQQYAAMHKNDPYTMSLALSEMNRRKETRSAQMGQQQQQPKVVDQAIAGMSQGLPEDSGIAQLPTGPMQYADGGIVAFAEAGQVTDPLAQYEKQIRSEAERQGVDPDMAVRMFRQESGGNKNAVSPKGASGLGQLMLPAAQEMGLSDKERFDPNKNIPASIGYFKKQQDRFGDPEIAAAAYNYGPGATARHLAQNNGQLNRVGLPKETADYLTKLFPAGSAQAEQVGTSFVPAQTSGAEGLIPTGGTATPPAATQEASGFFGNLGTRLGLSDDSKRNISNLSQALGGAMGAGYIPSMAVRGAAAAEKGIASLTPSVERIVAANPRAQAAQVRQAMARERMLNPELVGPPRSAMQAVSKAPEVAQAAPAGQGITQLAPRIGEAAQASQAARVVGNAASVGRIAGQAESARNLMPSAATIAQNPSGKPYAPFEENFTPQDLTKKEQNEVVAVAKDALPEKKSKGFSTEDLLYYGLSLLGGNSPYATQNFANAGLRTLANRAENKKAERDAAKEQADIDYKMQQIAESKQLTPARAEQYKAYAEQLAGKNQTSLDRGQNMAIAQAMAAYDKQNFNPAPGARDAYLRSIIAQQQAISAAQSGEVGAIPEVPNTGFKVIGSRPA